jgi:hypothetical protein
MSDADQAYFAEYYASSLTRAERLQLMAVVQSTTQQRKYALTRTDGRLSEAAIALKLHALVRVVPPPAEGTDAQQWVVATALGLAVASLLTEAIP